MIKEVEVSSQWEGYWLLKTEESHSLDLRLHEKYEEIMKEI
jgi:hypothetical protein